MTGCCASLTVRVYMQMEELMEKYANLRRAYCCQSFLIKKKKKKKGIPEILWAPLHKTL